MTGTESYTTTLQVAGSDEETSVTFDHADPAKALYRGYRAIAEKLGGTVKLVGRYGLTTHTETETFEYDEAF
jgi:hypothetical protein